MSVEESNKALACILNDKAENVYLNFIVESEIYCMAVQYVIQIVEIQEIIKMPVMLPYMKGCINLNGNVIPVISMRLRFGKTEAKFTGKTCIIVAKAGIKEIGFIVDELIGTNSINPKNITPPSNIYENVYNSYIKGIAHLSNDNTAIVLDTQKLFTY